MKKDKNAVALAGEFAVLSQLALRNFDANMTLGHTKGVDILVSDPRSKRMLRLEVKTKLRESDKQMAKSKIFGTVLAGWLMNKKHETIIDPSLFYCFVMIWEGNKTSSSSLSLVKSWLATSKNSTNFGAKKVRRANTPKCELSESGSEAKNIQ